MRKIPRDDITKAVLSGHVQFDMVCDVCDKPMVEVETDYGPGWRFDCHCHDVVGGRTFTALAVGMVVFAAMAIGWAVWRTLR